MATTDYSYLKYISPDDSASSFMDEDEVHSSFPEVELGLKEKQNDSGIPINYDKKGLKANILSGDSHTLIIGSTGSMKTRGVLVPTMLSLLAAGEHMVITDPKGEIHRNFSGLLKERGYDVHILNFRDPDHSERWNPLILPYRAFIKGDIDRYTGLLNDWAATLTAKVTGEKDPYWGQAANQMIRAMAKILFIVARDEKDISMGAIVDLYRAITTLSDDMGGDDYDYLKNLPEESRAAVESFIKSNVWKAKSTFAGITATTSGALAPYLTQSLTRIMAGCDIDFDDFAKEGKKVALFIVEPDERDTFSTVTATFVSQLYSCLIEASYARPDNRLATRLNFVLDEFANIARIPQMTSMITAARSRNIRFYLVLQSNSQLQRVYGEHTAQTIKYNCLNWVFLSSREPVILREVQELIGSGHDNVPTVSIEQLSSLRIVWPRVEGIVFSSRRRPYSYMFHDMSEYPSLWKGYAEDGTPIPYPEVIHDLPKDEGEGFKILKELSKRLQTSDRENYGKFFLAKERLEFPGTFEEYLESIGKAAPAPFKIGGAASKPDSSSRLKMTTTGPKIYDFANKGDKKE